MSPLWLSKMALHRMTMFGSEPFGAHSTCLLDTLRLCANLLCTLLILKPVVTNLIGYLAPCTIFFSQVTKFPQGGHQEKQVEGMSMYDGTDMHQVVSLRTKSLNDGRSQ